MPTQANHSESANIPQVNVTNQRSHSTGSTSASTPLVHERISPIVRRELEDARRLTSEGDLAPALAIWQRIHDQLDAHHAKEATDAIDNLVPRVFQFHFEAAQAAFATEDWVTALKYIKDAESLNANNQQLAMLRSSVEEGSGIAQLRQTLAILDAPLDENAKDPTHLNEPLTKLAALVGQNDDTVLRWRAALKKASQRHLELWQGALNWSSDRGEDEYGRWAILTLNEISVRFRWIHPGTFLMGTPPDEPGRFEPFEGNGPVRVTLTRGYWMAETPCTQGLWHEVMGTTVTEQFEKAGRPFPLRSQGPELPMYYVSWNETQEFLRRLNNTFPGLKARLPTEAEWEYAARAGTSGPQYGELDLIAWHRGNSNHDVHPVGSKLPNAWGIYDTIGLVEEWVHDLFWDLPTKPATDPRGPKSASHRVVKGSHWASHAIHSRVGKRDFAHPDERTAPVLGFRFIIMPPQSKGLDDLF